ncbi:MAG TPA: DUF11 domain-containing protein, partial [Candidatus Saccharimonadales bacterium]|nr:DUF11 domain-containing protein [Candidatus Saccharimonadales bacterium]
LTLTKGSVDQATGNTTYTLKATGSAKNATITGYTFSFGDQTSDKTVKTSATSTSVTHSNAPGENTAKVTVTGKDNNGKPLTATSANCQKSVSVPKPNSNLTCDELKLTPGAIGSDGSQAFVLTANATAKNATITGYTFSFGDQTSDQTVTTSATTATANHTYAPGTYTAKVTVNGKDNSGKAITATSANCQQPVNVSPKQNPNITITKHVDGQKTEQVDVNQQFVYQLVITNNGQQTLTNAVVTDPAPNGVTMLSADLGTVDTTKNSWSYTIPSLAVGESVNVNITAVVKQYMAGNIVNTACVNAPEVNPEQPNQPDSCDTATVTVTPPAAPQQLVNTGAGSVATIFAAAAIVGTALHRYFLTRRLSE